MTTQAVETYDTAVDGLERLGGVLEDSLRDLLAEANVAVHAIPMRVKGRVSADTKMLGDPSRYQNYGDLHDLLGLRVITLFESDIPKAAAVISELLDTTDGQVVDKRSSHNATSFGYRSMHFVGCLAKERRKLRELKRFSSQLVEVQLRSILQHAWAEIEHDLGYKPQRPLNEHLRRKFSQLAALMELADEGFSTLRHQVEVKEESISKAVDLSDEGRERQLDVAEVMAFVHRDDRVHYLDHLIAAQLKGEVLPPGKDFRAFCGGLLDACRAISLFTPDQLGAAIAEYVETGEAHRQEVVRSQWSSLDASSQGLRPGFSILLVANRLRTRLDRDK